MTRVLAMLVLAALLGCRSAPKTAEERYTRELARQEEAEARKARRAEKEAKLQERQRQWHDANQSSRAAWSEATGGKTTFGTPWKYPRKPGDPGYGKPRRPEARMTAACQASSGLNSIDLRCRTIKMIVATVDCGHNRGELPAIRPDSIVRH
jgi:hypothetical protein